MVLCFSNRGGGIQNISLLDILWRCVADITPAARRRHHQQCFISHIFFHPFSGNFMLFFFAEKKTYSCCHLPLLTLFHRSHFFSLTPSISLFGHQLRGSCFELKMSILRLVFPNQRLNFQFLDFCEEDLGLESGELGDEALTASSSYDPANVGPKNARWWGWR